MGNPVADFAVNIFLSQQYTDLHFKYILKFLIYFLSQKLLISDETGVLVGHL